METGKARNEKLNKKRKHMAKKISSTTKESLNPYVKQGAKKASPYVNPYLKEKLGR